ncbi:MAG TPA: hypothetical protein VFC51_02395 [Chloroflexota bacterium]|nr:hypothetical protein [Chloroflexota bacterium]
MIPEPRPADQATDAPWQRDANGAVRRIEPTALPSRSAAARPGRSGRLSDLLALFCLALVVLVSFRDPLIHGLIAFEKDTLVFFYPLEAWFGDEWKAGRFPLWNPYIFTGYPMFADGESGLANPLNLVLLRFLSAAHTLLWLRITSVFIGGAGAYALCRALGLRPLAAFLGGITFSVGSFFPSQQHHENILRTAAWLPLILACVEGAFGARGWRRQAYLTAGALALAMASVGLHPQVLAMVLIAFATFVVYRGLVAEAGQGRSIIWRFVVRGGRVVWFGLYVGLLGLALGAVQLVPLAELGSETIRGSQPDYFFATSYALPMQNLVDLIFPYFYRAPDSSYWSLWAKWETAIYVGIAPFVLGMVGVLFSRKRSTPYFVGLAMVGLWLAFASYAPVDLYRLLWSLPGFSAFRVPGRYTYLFVFAWSVLAAMGLQATADARFWEHRGRRAAMIGLIALLAASGAVLVYGMRNLRTSMLADPTGAAAWINTSYLALRHHLEGLETGQVYRGLVASLDLGNHRTAFSLALLVATVALLMGATLSRRTLLVWRSGLVGLAIIDLLAFGSGLHQEMPISQFEAASPAIRFLAHCGSTSPCRAPAEGEGDALLEQWRVYTPGTIPSVEFDRLVPFRIADVGGYASPDLRRNFTYWAGIDSVQNQFLDLANVRYLVYPAHPVALPSYRNVPYDPMHPLMAGSASAIGGDESFAFDGARGDRLQLLASLTRSVTIPQGEVVAEITVVPRSGQPVQLAVRAGEDVAEAAYDRPDVRGRVQHDMPAETAFERPDVYLADGSTYQRRTYYSERDLPRTLDVDHVEVRYVDRTGGIEVYGIGIYNFATHATAGVTQENRTKLREVYSDADVRIFENADAFPRAYVVPSARIARDADNGLADMQEAPFDPSTQVMLASPPAGFSRAASDGDDSGASPAGRSRRPIPAEAMVVTPDRAVYRASAPSGGYFVRVANDLPGWRAWVDGREEPILLANGLFQAVPVGPGAHVVELRYEPRSVELGVRVSALAALIALGMLSGALISKVRRGGSASGAGIS